MTETTMMTKNWDMNDSTLDCNNNMVYRMVQYGILDRKVGDNQGNVAVKVQD